MNLKKKEQNIKKPLKILQLDDIFGVASGKPDIVILSGSLNY